MHGGVTVILTLLKPENRYLEPENGNLKLENRNLESEPNDEQLHVLPHYAPDDTDEFGSREGQLRKIQTGELEVLHQFERTLITRATRKKGCKRGHPTGNRKKFLDR